MLYRADFHIHSCLSPCAALEMSPNAIVQRAVEVGLNAIALSDHNCTFNLPAFASVCAKHQLDCLFGIEVTTIEEAHILCLFDHLDAAMQFGERVYESLPDIPNQPERFGDQPIIDENDQVLGFAEKFLISASSYDVNALLDMVHSLGGLVVPAHIDRSVFGIISQLGFLPEENFDAVELTAQGNIALARHYPVLRNSDAHQLMAIGAGYSEFDMATWSLSELRKALSGQD